MTAARNLALSTANGLQRIPYINLDHLLELFTLRRDAAGLQQ